jgi:hypothetical protein
MVKNFLSNLGNNYKGLTLKERLMGQQMPSTDEVDIDTEALKGIDTSNPYFLENYGAEAPTVNITASSTPRKGGILPDIASGYRENYATGFAAPNLGENQLDDGRNKGFAYRLGEGLGSIGRFIDSPLGRGLIAAGLNKALGYDNSLQEGLTAAVGRQNAQTADKVYRQQLSQMGYKDEDLASIRGNITPEIYKGLTDSFKLGNNRMTYGQLAMFDEGVAEQIRQNPELANQFIPMTFAKDIYGKKRELADEKIANDKTKIAQNDRRLNILQQRVNQGAATARELSEYRALKMEQMQLENALYEKELGRTGGNGGGTTGGAVRPVGQTKSGVKYKVVE